MTGRGEPHTLARVRDGHRIKEKLSLSIDHRHIGGFFFVSILVLGTVFVLGVQVGRQLSREEGLARPGDLLSELDQKAQVRADAAQEPPLTFQDELTRKAKPEPHAEAPRPAKPPELVVPAPPNEEPVPAPAIEGAVEEAGVAARTVSPDASSLREAFARAERKPQEVVPDGAFTLQLAATQSRSEADHFVEAMRAKGFGPYVVEADVPGKGLWYRVRMGGFPTKEAAGRYLQDFRRETQVDAFVTPMK